MLKISNTIYTFSNTSKRDVKYSSGEETNLYIHSYIKEAPWISEYQMQWKAVVEKVFQLQI